MAYKGARVWVKDGGDGIAKNAIDDNGVWELQESGTIRSDVDAAVYFSSVSADASGATVAVGLRTVAGKTPVAVTDMSKALAGLATGQDSYDKVFLPKGRICLTVTDYVAPFVAEVTQ